MNAIFPVFILNPLLIFFTPSLKSKFSVEKYS